MWVNSEVLMKFFHPILFIPMIYFGCNSTVDSNQDIKISDSTMVSLRRESIVLGIIKQSKYSVTYNAEIDTIISNNVLDDLELIYRKRQEFRELIDKYDFRYYFLKTSLGFQVSFYMRDSASAVNDSALNFMIQKYQMQIAEYRRRDQHSSFVSLKSTKPLISEIMINEYKSVQDDTSSYLSANLLIPGSGDYSDINIVGNVKTYKFNLNWGDCPSGCIYGHYWIYNLIGSTVHLVDEAGTPLEKWSPN
jgi:hypothetical protein